MMYYRITKNEKILFFGKKNRPGVGSDLKFPLKCTGGQYTLIHIEIMINIYCNIYAACGMMKHCLKEIFNAFF